MPISEKQRLAEQQAADLVVVETGECPPRRSRLEYRIYEGPPFAVIIRDDV